MRGLMPASFKDSGLSVERRIEILERAELLQEFRRGLLPDPFHAGNVIRRVAAQRLVIDDALRPEAVAFAHAVLVVEDRVVDAFAHRVDGDARGDELQRIHVARCDDGRRCRHGP